jgi:two-component system cell cycle sensor histidine kinase/response regulator CckA
VSLVVVEDDRAVRHFVSEVLRRRGAEVKAFGLPAEALEWLADPDRRVDLVLTDVIMPGMNGPALVKAVQRHRPGIKTLFMSGYTSDEAMLEGALGAAAMLEKPFSPGDLVDRVTQALAED